MNVIGEVLLRSITSVPKVVSLWRRFPIGSVALRTRYGAWSRAQYAYGTFHAAQQAKLLGLDGISVIEFGVDRGDGLLALESIAREVANYFGIRISAKAWDKIPIARFAVDLKAPNCGEFRRRERWI